MNHDDTEDYIPLLDMNEWFSGDEATKTKFAQKWNKAFSTSGFCTIINHGVPSSATHDMYQSTTTFFDLPLEEKSKYASPDFFGPGYHEAGRTNWEAFEKKENAFDQNEHFKIVSRHPSTILPTEDKIHPLLLQSYKNYWQQVKKLTSILHEISDRALGLPPGTFAKFHTQDNGDFCATLRLTDYYELPPEAISAGVIRVGGHTDYMCFTLLKCDEVRGLEVAYGEQDYDLENIAPTKFEKWVPVEPVKDAFVINAGDMLRYWTNGHWKSAFHRVVALPERRVSLVFFTGPSLSARTDDRFPCEVCGGPDKFPSLKMSMADYFGWRHKKAEVKK